jgi:hypothetical protein
MALVASEEMRGLRRIADKVRQTHTAKSVASDGYSLQA